MITIIKDDIFNSPKEYAICHQVNSMGVMGSGIALLIKQKYPEVYKKYQELCQCFTSESKTPLGKRQVLKTNDNRTIINMFAQLNFGNDKRYTNYEAFARCLEQIVQNHDKTIPIAFPALIGADRASGNWTIIYTMIKEYLGKDFQVYIYDINNILNEDGTRKEK